ncbi:helix-turn-helix transcriptional regulator [Paraburkholderia tropica]|uniref:helix-turn-helix transcriptional regulator n=1 Tax=Paraburkholderia tropica TaxID=92647 RepID=UPI002AB675D0|nr:helix-turn-helix transcriptional regulator [Paraburkholderia tropica]
MQLLARADDADELRVSLGLSMLDLLGADTYVSMVWNAKSERFERGEALNVPVSRLREWDEYYRLIDPLTFEMMARREPTIATQIVAQPELIRTEFFNDFLRPDGQHWGINAYFFDQGVAMGDFRIWRARDRGNFGANEIELLRMLESPIAATLGRLGRQSVQTQLAVPVTLRAEEILQREANLSQREAEVAALVANGLSDKQIARHLDIGIPTVRYHLGNVFRKMHASNRTSVTARVCAIVD